MNVTLQSILDLTDRVQAAIDAGDWQLAQELETDRRGRLEMLVAVGGTTSEMLAAMSTLEQRNRRLVGIVQHHKRRVLREASMEKANHVAANAYAAPATSRRGNSAT